MNSKHRTAENVFGCFEGDVAEGIVFTRCGGDTADSASSGKVSFSADPLRTDRIDFVFRFLVVAGQVTASGLRLVSFTKLDPDLVRFLAA